MNIYENEQRKDEDLKKKVVLKYKEVRNEKGESRLEPVYLRETPKEDIDRMNSMFKDCKTTKQVRYDKEGMRE